MYTNANDSYFCSRNFSIPPYTVMKSHVRLSRNVTHMNKRKAILTAYLISFIYVGIGTVAVLSEYPSSPLSGEWVPPVLFFTLPVSALGVGIMNAGPGLEIWVLLAQLFIFFLFARVVYRVIIWLK